MIPQEFNAFEVTNPLTATMRASIVTNDNNVVYRWLPNTRVFGTVFTTAIIANEINRENNDFDRADSTSITIATNDSSNDNAFNTTLMFF